MKYAVASVIASALTLGCNAEVERTENFEYAFNEIAEPGASEFEFAAPDSTANLRVLLEADVEAHDFDDAKIEFSRVELGTCVDTDTCATIDWQVFGSAHFMLSELGGGTALTIGSEVDLGVYDEIRFSAASAFVDTEDRWREVEIVTQTVAIPLNIELGAEQRIDVRVLFDAPTSLENTIDDRWTLDPVLTVEDVTVSEAL